MSQNDPTDNALAAIASILDQTTSPPEPAKIADKTTAPIEQPPVAMPPPLPQSIEAERIEAEHAEPEYVEPEQNEPPPIQSIEANGYSKAGPGPMAALRFRWTVRENGGRYYVDETVGERSTPLVNGPMDGDAAIRFVDDREAEARQRFEHFKLEMISRTAIASLAPKDGGET
ncbi:hypothetical protein [Bradyrhizobium genosp. P]|uniref:hypothetical protein n=1 Tax=Bradyrhizobium genosp. P TaxID=83641 RepID=UPI003CECBC83